MWQFHQQQPSLLFPSSWVGNSNSTNVSRTNLQKGDP
jgi:hypothetical protein